MRLILGPMVIILSKSLLHSGYRSRQDGDNNGSYLEDRRFFSYVWPSVTVQPKSRSKIRINSSKHIHRYKESLYDDLSLGGYCECNKGATILDLSFVTGYQVGERYWETLRHVDGWY